ncbi:WD40-repeat-containing domain protein [Lasiosphaeria miniovina]|uniref:Pre-mRNA-splicing factor PRP46 n=1 Tax=Lasiosphaeria miniovina TaxID=1954250 RepID=A0AA40EFS6_9PEZI|nr:WD40-repeat-containing domain protein [Lasiosphaeria miniovina]KAK0733608.1 WD40-repeat-containing domain protein [Lasiosphaeria miniovina]
MEVSTLSAQVAGGHPVPDVDTSADVNDSSLSRLEALILENARSSKSIYSSTIPNSSGRKRLKLDPALASLDPDVTKTALSLRLHAEYSDVLELPEALASKIPAAGPRKKQPRPNAAQDAPSKSEEHARKLIEGIPAVQNAVPLGGSSSALVLSRKPGTAGKPAQTQQRNEPYQTSLAQRSDILVQPRPDWHPPWKLMRVISGHLGWVRALAIEPDNKWFASGAGDRTIKIWDLASGALKLTLTGHISTVRGLAVSPRHPYLFSCGEDKMVKCWDLETNKVIRHYHGHLSGVYTLALHPTLDVLVTGGRDGVARVWDMRTRSNVHVLSGHTGTIASLVCQEADPQVVTASLDSTVRMWDLAAGKTMGVLTHHKKGVRALATHPNEFTFASGSTGSIKQWKCPEGAFMQNFDGHNAIINTLSVNDQNILFSGGDNGSMSFWDWKSGHRFQALDTIAQPGSLDAESGIMSSMFDLSGTRLICGETDKTIKIWKADENATPETHPLDWKPAFATRKF